MSYNSIIWCAGHVGRTDLAKQFYQQILRTKHLSPNVYTYGSLMHGFAKTKNYRQALFYLDHMMDGSSTQNRIVPNQIVFTSAMEACAEAGQYKEALNVMTRITDAGRWM